VSTTPIGGLLMIGDSDSKQHPIPAASGLLLNPPSTILHSLGKLGRADVSTASAYSINQKIVSLLLTHLLLPHTICYHIQMQAVEDWFVTNGMSSLQMDVPFLIVATSMYATTVLSILQHMTATTKQSSVLTRQLNRRDPILPL